MYGLDTETVSSAKEFTLFCNENKIDKSGFVCHEHSICCIIIEVLENICRYI